MRCRRGWPSPRSRTCRSRARRGRATASSPCTSSARSARPDSTPGRRTICQAGRYGHHGIPHGWGFVLQQLLDGQPDIPVVPVFVNTFWEPNPPSAQRCYEFGAALGAAIRSSPLDIRVGLVASGGLSHFVIDEELDRGFLKALVDKDRDFMSDLPGPLLRSGTSELRNWIVVGGAAAETPLRAQVVDYLPCYRSEAGTGCGMAFVAWQPPRGTAVDADAGASEGIVPPSNCARLRKGARSWRSPQPATDPAWSPGHGNGAVPAWAWSCCLSCRSWRSSGRW